MRYMTSWGSPTESPPIPYPGKSMAVISRTLRSRRSS